MTPELVDPHRWYWDAQAREYERHTTYQAVEWLKERGAVNRIWWCSDWQLTMTVVQDGLASYVEDPVTMRSPCTEERRHDGDECGWHLLIKESDV